MFLTFLVEDHKKDQIVLSAYDATIEGDSDLFHFSLQFMLGAAVIAGSKITYGS